MNRRGVSSVMAIVLIGVVASILASVAAFAAAEQRRSAIERADAQASQLLAAAAVVAGQQLSDNKPADGDIDTPLGRVTLTWQGTRCTVDVRHQHAGRHAVLTFVDRKLTTVD